LAGIYAAAGMQRNGLKGNSSGGLKMVATAGK
jgi:hypothetical protein